jgi:hypothetical protein
VRGSLTGAVVFRVTPDERLSSSRTSGVRDEAGWVGTLDERRNSFDLLRRVGVEEVEDADECTIGDSEAAF